MNSGLINLWKPAGITSHDAVARVRRVTGVDRIGHAGTLDPAAEGVLPLAVGTYTRLLPYLDLVPKVYRAEVVQGIMTNTSDSQGRIVARSPVRHPKAAQLSAAARWLQGPIWQIPPQVSARKSGGRRHYDTVRRGGVVWPKPRRALIESIDSVTVTEQGWSFVARVGAGTYVRALVRDWAFLMGEAACLHRLSRLRVGTFDASSAVTLDTLVKAALWQEWLDSWHAHVNVTPVPIGKEAALRVRDGDPGVLHRVMEDVAPGPAGLIWEGRLMAIADGPPWQYRVVFREGI